MSGGEWRSLWLGLLGSGVVVSGGGEALILALLIPFQDTPRRLLKVELGKVHRTGSGKPVGVRSSSLRTVAPAHKDCTLIELAFPSSIAASSSSTRPEAIPAIQERLVEETNALFFFHPPAQSQKISLKHRNCLPLLKSSFDPAGLIFEID